LTAARLGEGRTATPETALKTMCATRTPPDLATQTPGNTTMNEKTGRIDAHEAAGWAPLLCAAHCAAVPGLALLAPALIVPQSLEQVLMLATVLMAGLVLHAGLRVHADRRVLTPAVAGSLLWVAALLEALPAPEPVAVGAGGLLLYAGLRWNSRRRREALSRCGCGCGT
jgi:hypothetical protein